MTDSSGFWAFTGEVEPRLASWPVGGLVRLVDGGEPADDPVAAVERAAGRTLTAEERGLVMLRVLAPADVGTPSEAMRVAFAHAAGQREPWAAAISLGALGIGAPGIGR